MELLIAFSLMVGVFLVGIFGNLVSSELYDRLPQLAGWLIRIAVKRLPENQRARFEEEWMAHLEECPGKLGRFIHAAGCFLGAAKLTRTLNGPKAASVQENQRRDDVSSRIELSELRSKIAKQQMALMRAELNS